MTVAGVTWKPARTRSIRIFSHVWDRWPMDQRFENVGFEALNAWICNSALCLKRS